MQVWLQPSVSTRRGGSCTRGGKPDASGNPGRPEGLPRTAAIKRHLILARVSTPVRRIVSDTSSVGGQHFQDKPMGADSVRRIFPRTGYLPAISCPQALSQRSCCTCGSRLACDGFGAVSARSRSLHRGQARLPQAARALLEPACLRWPRWGVREFAVSASRASPAPTGCAGSVGAGLPAMRRWGVREFAASVSRARPAPTAWTRALLELACLRWRRRGVSAFAESASRARPAPTGCAGSVGAGLPAMASARCP